METKEILVRFVVPAICAALAAGVSAFIAYGRGRAFIRGRMNALDGRFRVYRDTLCEALHVAMGKPLQEQVTVLELSEAVQESARIMADMGALREEVKQKKLDHAGLESRIVGMKEEWERTVLELYRKSGLDKHRDGLGKRSALDALRAWIDMHATREDLAKEAEEWIDGAILSLAPEQKGEPKMNPVEKVRLLCEKVDEVMTDQREITTILGNEAAAQGLAIVNMKTVGIAASIVARLQADRKRLDQLLEFGQEIGTKLQELGLAGKLEPIGVSVERIDAGTMVGTRRAVRRGGQQDLPAAGFPGIIIKDDGNRTMPGNREGEIHAFDPERPPSS